MEPAPSVIKAVILNPTCVVDQPLLQLLIQLTSSYKSQTLLRNTGIIDILNEEFNINTNSMNYVEVEIYVNLIKRFLMDWPHWDRFALIVGDLRKKNQQEFLDSTLRQEYEKLKTYLTKILAQSKTVIKDIVKSEDLIQNANEDTSEVLMEISCTRSQLNTLLFQTPQGLNKTIFNGSNLVPCEIVYLKPPLKSILNWFDIEIFINTHFFSYTRSNAHKLSHKIINRKAVGKTVQKIVLDDNIKENSSSKITVDMESVLKFLHKFKENIPCLHKNKYWDTIELVLDLLRRDIQILNIKNIYVQGKYKFSLSKYAYLRYLCKESDENNSEYDIRLEEIVSPTNVISINRFTEISNIPKLPNDWLRIKCVLCDVKFYIDGIDNLVIHFMEKHSNEPDWMCTNCLKIFSMSNLTRKDWYHECLN